MKIAFANVKGGVGKTTLAVLAALGLHAANWKVGFFDYDLTGTAGIALSDTGIPCNIGNPDSYDVAIYDTPARVADSNTGLSVLKLADKIVLVSTPYPVDFPATYETTQLLNPTKTKLLWNKVRRGTTYGDASLSDLARKLNLSAYETVFGLKECFPQTLESGLFALSFPDRAKLATFINELTT